MKKIITLLLGIILVSSCKKDKTTESDSCTYTVSYLTETAVGSYTAPNGDIHGTSGVYESRITNVAGCDSIITINLTITVPIAIGDFAEGGIVFWLDGNGGGLVCAIADQSNSIQWNSGVQKWTGASGTAIGTGDVNTTKIISFQGSPTIDYAANIANTYIGNGYTDWFLPSKLELAEINKNKNTINTSALANGGTALSNIYWSSTEYNTDYAYFYVLPANDSFTNNKKSTSSVRAVRAF